MAGCCYSAQKSSSEMYIEQQIELIELPFLLSTLRLKRSDNQVMSVRIPCNVQTHKLFLHHLKLDQCSPAVTGGFATESLPHQGMGFVYLTFLRVQVKLIYCRKIFNRVEAKLCFLLVLS